jgi:hypothetical protein
MQAEAPPSHETSARLPLRLVIFLLVAGAVPRIWALIGDQGTLWPDEIFQSLEPAHRWVFGYGFVAWEFQEGARSWLLPGALALLWKVATLLGVGSAPALVLLAKGAMVALALLGSYAAIRLAERLAGPPAGFLAGALAASFPAGLIYGHRCMGEMASAPLVVLSALLLQDSDRRRLFLAGLLAGLAIHLRYQTGLIAVGFLLIAWARSGREDAVPFGLGATLAGLAGGLLDWITWGQPFHSFLVYVHYNLIEGRSAKYGVAPLLYYAKVAWTSTGIPIVLILAGALAAWRRAAGFLWVALAYVLAHALVPHKEFRFLMPIVPLLLATSGVGIARILEQVFARRAALRLPAAAAIGVAASLLMGQRAADATLASIGRPADPQALRESVWRHGDGLNRALWEVGKQPDLCGVLLVGTTTIWSGGYSYLHRDVPFLWATHPLEVREGARAANYLIAPPSFPEPAPYVQVHDFRGWRALRREGGCAPPPPGYTRQFWNPLAASRGPGLGPAGTWRAR